MSNQDFAGEARVVIVADTSKFAEELRTKLERVKVKPYQVKVTPDTRGFADAIRTSLSRITIAPFKVLVEPDFSGFKRKLQTGINEAKQGATIPVPISAIGGATTKTRAADVTTGASNSVKKAADNTKNLTKAEKEVESAVKAGTFARQRLSDSLDETERRAERLTRTEEFLAASVRAGNTALKEQNAEARAAAQALEKRARAELQGIQNAQARAAAPGLRAEAVDAEAAAKLETERQRALQETADLEKKFLDDHADAIARNQAIDDKATKAFEDDQKKRRDAMQKDIDQRAAILTKNAQLPIVNQAFAKDKTFELQTAAAEQLAFAQRFVSTSSNKVVAAQQALKAATVATDIAQEAFEVSLLTADKALQRQTADALLAARALGVLRGATLAQAEADARLAAADAARAASRAKDVATGIRGFGAQLAQFAGVRGATLAASTAFIAGTVAAVAFGKAIKSAAALESELNVFRVVAGATADEMERTSQVARELGADLTLPSVSAVDAAQAISLLSKAGLDVEDALGGAKGVLQLATAAQITNAEATELAASALNAFGLAGTEAVHVADVLANSANLAQGSITDVGIAMQQASAVARQVGLSFEDTVALLTLLARNGIRGSDAGTALRVAFTRLTAPTKEAAKVLKELNVQVLDAQGNLRPAIFADIAEAQKDLSRETQNANAKIIFGVDALRAYSIAAREGKVSLQETRAALGEQGSAAELAGARMSGLTGATENLKNQLSALGLTIGAVLVPPLTAVTTGFAIFIKMINDTLKFSAQAVGSIFKLSEAINDLGRIRIGDFGLGDALLVLPGTVKIVKKAFGDGFKATEADADQLIDKLAELGRIEEKNKGRSFRPSGFNKEVKQSTDALTKIAVQIRQTGNNNALAGFAKRFAKELPEAGKALEDGIIDPTEKAQLEATRLGKIFLKAVPKDKIVGGFTLDLSGINAAVQEVSSLGPDVRSRIEEASREAARGARGFGVPIGAALRQSLNAAFFSAIAVANTGLRKLELEFLELDVSGAPNSVLQKNLNAQIDEQNTIIERAQERLAGLGTKKDPKTKAARQKTENILKEAFQEKKGLQDQIKSLSEETAQNAKEKADDVKRAQDEADQALLDSLDLGRAGVERRLTRAQSTEGASDNVAALLAFRKRILSDIEKVSKGVQDVKERNKQLKTLNDELVKNAIDIKDAREARDQQLNEALTDRGEALVAQGERTGLTRLIIRGLDLQIRAAREIVARAKAAKSGLAAAKAALDDLIQQRKDAVTSARTALLDQAFALQEARGNKSGMLQILDLQIAEARKEARRAKSLIKQLEAQTKIQELINKKKEILEDTAKEGQDQGTSAFELLKQNVETFVATGGNLIGGNQPFAGATGFTADVAQFLVRQRPAAVRGRVNSLDDPRLERPELKEQNDLTRKLIDALNNLTQATLGTSGNNSTAGLPSKALDALGQRGRAQAQYYESIKPRTLREARSGI